MHRFRIETKKNQFNVHCLWVGGLAIAFVLNNNIYQVKFTFPDLSASHDSPHPPPPIYF